MTNKIPAPAILVAVDIIVLAVHQGKIKVLLVQRSDIKTPTRVLPGGFVTAKETLALAAKRVLKTETWYDKFNIHPIKIFDEPKRDSRWRVISAPFLALTNTTDFPFKDGIHTKNATFFSLNRLPTSLYDHKDIIKEAFSFLQENIMHTDIAKDLFPKEFTLTHIQQTYEQILKKELNTRNFRTKLLEENIVIPTWNIQLGVWHRPAQYYTFRK